MSTTEFARTGVPGVDELLGEKGIPRGYTTFVLGGPGSGKTLFALQFLYQGARKFNENGIYISLDEDMRYVKAEAKSVGIDIESLEKEDRLSLIDASPIRKFPPQLKVGEFSIGKRDFSLVSLMDILKKQVRRVNAQRLVIDPMVGLTLQYPDDLERRTAVLDLMQAIAETQCTSLLVTELGESGIDRRYQFEEFLAQGVIMMRRFLRAGVVVRHFQVEKMRRLSHDDQPHPYKIEQGGITVYPTELAY